MGWKLKKGNKYEEESVLENYLRKEDKLVILEKDNKKSTRGIFAQLRMKYGIIILE